MCKAVTEAGADYIKTSTGFGTAGATLEDIRLFRENIGQDVKMKAAAESRQWLIWKHSWKQDVIELVPALQLN